MELIFKALFFFVSLFVLFLLAYGIGKMVDTFIEFFTSDE